jgi:hypothetical protein
MNGFVCSQSSYVRNKLGVGDRTWEACNYDVYTRLESDFERSYLGLVPTLLQKIRVLLYTISLSHT